MAVISKTVLTLVVMHRSDMPLDDMSLEEIAAETDTGHMVGAVTRSETHTLEPQEVGDELMKLGNDGSFFEYDLNQEEE